ncbi:hypothetical protein WJX72_006339 [[Myrmecia] bisecta]|uniref:Uncharacterized protein n=1 Tax=[Myrmecia] bisecta TaxID=41462 RepID=A0AAW1QAA8_9CHLO
MQALGANSIVSAADVAAECRYTEYKEKGWQYWSDPALEVLEAEADAGDFERIQGDSPRERILPKHTQVLKMLRDMEKGPEPTRTSGAHAYLDAFKDSPLLGKSKRKRIKAHLTEMASMREKLLREEAMMAKAPDEPEELGLKAIAEVCERRSNMAKEAKSQKRRSRVEHEVVSMGYEHVRRVAKGLHGDGISAGAASGSRPAGRREACGGTAGADPLDLGKIKAAAAPAKIPGVLLEWLADPAGKPWLVPNALAKKIVDRQVGPEHRAKLFRQLLAKPACCWPHDVPSPQQLFLGDPLDFELLKPEDHWKEWCVALEHAAHWEAEQPEDRKDIRSIDHVTYSVCNAELPTELTKRMRTVHDYAMAHVMERLTVLCMCNKGIGQESCVECGRHSSSQSVLQRGYPEDDLVVREAYANCMVRGALLLWMHQEHSHPEERAPPDCVQRIHTALQAKEITWEAKEITWEGLGPVLQELARLHAGNGCASEQPSPTSWGTASCSPDDFDSLALPGVGPQDDHPRSLPSGPSSSSGGRQGDLPDAAGLKPGGSLGPPIDFIGHLHQRAREYILRPEVQGQKRQKILHLRPGEQKHMERPLN